MAKFLIVPYKMSSGSAKLLANALNCKRMRKYGRMFYRHTNRTYINWGCSHFPDRIVGTPPNWKNQTNSVYRAIHKLKAYDLFKQNNIPTVDYTKDPEVARTWIESGITVYGRTCESSHGGIGITIFQKCMDIRSEEFSQQTFFTRRFKNHREFRVHVVGTKAILVQEKKRRQGSTSSSYIRSHSKDWVFCKNNLAPYPEQVVEYAIKAVQVLGLDFGGVDIALNKQGDVCVLEVNTAPGLTPSTAAMYAEALRVL